MTLLMGMAADGTAKPMAIAVAAAAFGSLAGWVAFARIPPLVPAPV